jgi:hypothetical protein
VCITLIRSEPGERAEVSRLIAKLIAECLAKQNVPFHVGD